MTDRTQQMFTANRAAKDALAAAGFTAEKVTRATGFGVYRHEDGRSASLGMHPVGNVGQARRGLGHAYFVTWWPAA